MNEDYDSVSELYSSNKLQGWGGGGAEVNGHALREKIEIFTTRPKIRF